MVISFLNQKGGTGKTTSFATLNTSVSQRVIFAEAATKGLAVFEVDDSSQATKEIEKLVSEMEKKEQIDEERSSIHQS